MRAAAVVARARAAMRSFTRRLLARVCRYPSGDPAGRSPPGPPGPVAHRSLSDVQVEPADRAQDGLIVQADVVVRALDQAVVPRRVGRQSLASVMRRSRATLGVAKIGTARR
jgi:hypothetical protein